MKFLDAASLPKDLQGARVGATHKKATDSWLDAAKLPPLPIGAGWIDVDTALTLTHDRPEFRHALRQHSQPEALDRFAVELCRQLPDSEQLFNRYMMWRAIAEDLGGPETADFLAKTIIRKDGPAMLRHGAAYALAVIGDRIHIPAIALCLLRMDPGFYRTCVEQRLCALTQRLKLSPAEFEDWSLPDQATPAETVRLRAAHPARLEKAMLTGRRWTVDTFDRRIARQPVMAPLAAGLVWGYFNEAGRLLEAFLVGPDGCYPPAPAGASVGIVHPAHMTPEQAAYWREQSRTLSAPFAQWKSSAITLTPEEGASHRVPRLPANTMPAARLLCRLEALGWQRPKTRTRLDFHTRTFPELGVTAVIRYSGIPLQYGGEWVDQSVVDCFFTANQEQLPLSRVSPIAISAILGDLNALAGGTR